jgi:acetyl-CoA carboxylase biotin carboxyl carrier protein
MLTFDEIKEIINRVEQSSIQHFELEQKKSKLIISKVAVPKMPVDSSQEPQFAAPKALERTQKFTEEVTDSKTETLHTIVSPTVGTFYAAPEPGADPFVQVGMQIQDKTIVCVLEAMKLFNEVEAGANGQIVELLARDGDFIEYGQPLFLVKMEG